MTHFRGYGRNTKKIVLFLVQMKTLKFAPEIYRPLALNVIIVNVKQDWLPFYEVHLFWKNAGM